MNRSFHVCRNTSNVFSSLLSQIFPESAINLTTIKVRKICRLTTTGKFFCKMDRNFSSYQPAADWVFGFNLSSLYPWKYHERWNKYFRGLQLGLQGSHMKNEFVLVLSNLLCHVLHASLCEVDFAVFCCFCFSSSEKKDVIFEESRGKSILFLF